MLTLQAKRNNLRALCPSTPPDLHPELVEEALQALGSGKRIKAWAEDGILFMDDTEADNIPIERSVRCLERDMRAIVGSYLMEDVIGWSGLREDVMFPAYTNPYIARLEDFTCALVLGPQRMLEPHKKLHTSLVKSFISTRQITAPESMFIHARRGTTGTIGFRQYISPFVQKLLEDDLFEMIGPVQEEDMTLREFHKLIFRSQRTCPMSLAEIPQMDHRGWFRIRLKNRDINENMRTQLAHHAGIPRDAVLPKGAEQFLEMLPEKYLSLVYYCNHDRANVGFNLRGLRVNNVKRKRESTDLVYQGALWLNPKRPRLTKLPDVVPIPTALVCSVSAENIPFDNASKPYWTGFIKKESRAWELQMAITNADGSEQQEYVKYSAWKGTRKGAKGDGQNMVHRDNTNFWQIPHHPYVHQNVAKAGFRPLQLKNL